MTEYEIICYHNEDCRSEYVSLGICQGLRSARKLAYKTFNEKIQHSDIVVEIVTYCGQYTVETISYTTVYGEEIA